jgi:hypothetical protein
VAWGDPRILRQILRESQRIGDPHERRVFQRAAVQTGLVESGGRNLPGGTGDSAGWRQERASLYPNPTNVSASVRRFRQEFQRIYRPGLKSYDAAARIQRPAAQYLGRYHDVAGQAASLLRGRQGTQGGGGGAGGGSPAIPGSPGTPGAQNVPVGSVDPTALLALLGQRRAPAQSAGLAPPAFSARPQLPQGAQVPASGGGPAPPLDVNAVLDTIRTVGGNVDLAPGMAPTAGRPGTSAVTGGIGSTATGRGRGRVVLAPGADRAGVRTRGDVLNFAREVSGIAGETLRIGTGSNHSRLTVNGTVSDHWRGEGADIPKRGRELIRIGQAALIAAGMDPKKARKQTGGGFNVGDWQIIFNTDAPGWGDHTTHLHIGRRRQ